MSDAAVESRPKQDPVESDVTNNAGDNADAGDAAAAGRSEAVSTATDLADRSNIDILKKLAPRDIPSDFPTVSFSDMHGMSSPPSGPEAAKVGSYEVAKTGATREGDATARNGVKKDENGRVTEVTYPDGRTRQFGYDEKGELNRIVQPNGEIYVKKDGKWQVDESAAGGAAPGHPGPRTQGLEGGSKGQGAPAGPGQTGEQPKLTDKERSSTGTDQVGNTQQTNDGSPFGSTTGNGLSAPRELDFKNPTVKPDGTFSFERNDGSTVTHKVDGTKEVKTKDGAIVKSDANDRVTSVKYSNGDTREFQYSPSGEMVGVIENGRYQMVINGKMYGSDGRLNGARNPSVTSDGEYSFTDKNNNFVTIKPDRSTDTYRADNSVVRQDGEGRVTAVTTPDNKTTRFEYDSSGRMTSMTDPDGKKFEFNGTSFLGFRSGNFRAADGTTRSDISVKPDGTITYKDQAGKIHTDFSNGTKTETTLTADQIRDIAKELHGTNGLLTDNSRIKEALQGMSNADRVALDEQYKQMTGGSLSDRLRSQLDIPRKRDNSLAALDMLSEAHLRQSVQRNFDAPDQVEANRQIDEFRKRAREAGVSTADIIAGQDKARQDMDREGQRPSEKMRGLEKNLHDVAPTNESLNTKYGVKYDEVTRPDGTKARQYYVEGEGGKKLPVLETTSDNPREIEKQLREWQSNKIAELEKRHGIQFSKDGERDNPLGKEVELRAPRINELMALERGLHLSQPSTGDHNGRPILVQFAVTPSSTHDAYVYPRPDGQSRIMFEPLQRNFRGLQDTILHEWGHVAENKMKDRDKATLDKWYSEMGYRQVTTPDGSKQWQLRDKDGNHWTQGPGQVPFGTWTRVDDQGRPLKADGTPASGFNDTNAATRSNDQMRDNAAVKPPTVYFPNPGEMGAESLMKLRGDSRSRGELYQNDPNGYRAAKEFDQREIDTHPSYGKNPDGTSRFIRSPEGDIVPNTPENRKIVEDYEKGLEAQRQAAKVQPPTTTQQPSRPEEQQQRPTHQHQHGGVCPGCN